MSQFIEQAEMVVGFRWIEESVEGEHPTPIKGNVAIGEPDVKWRTKLPSYKEDPESYKRLIRWVLEHDRLEILRLHWPSTMDLVNELMEKDFAVPPELNPESTYPHYELKLSFLKKETFRG